ncbi:MAG: CHAT domain-containing protein [Symploca sp. SIO2C1]|nr:CHAT domain-containing protein [Symploca sp. SIO2C1]
MKNFRFQLGVALATFITTSIASTNSQILAAQPDFDGNTIPTEQLIAQGRTVDLLWQQVRELQGIGRYVEALAILDQIIRLQPDSFLAWYWRGDIFNRLGDYQRAISAYDDAIAIRPDYLLAWWSKGNSLYQLQRYQAAITSWQQALTLPASSDYQQQLVSTSIPKQIARVQLYDLQRYTDAITTYNQLVAIDADVAANWLNRGVGFYQLSQYQNAIADFDRALQLEPQNSLAWKRRGLALYRLQRYQDAIASWENAARFNPQDLEITELLSAIETSDTSVAQLENSQRRLVEVRREINVAEERLSALRDESQELTAQLESSQVELRQSQQELTEIQQEVETAQTELRQSQQEFTEIQQEVETAQTELRQSQQELAETQQEVETTQVQLESSQTELRQSQQEFTEIQQEVETAQTELRQSQQELTEIRQEVEITQAQLESSQTELRQSQQEFTETQQEVETAQAQLESSQTELRQSRQEFTEIQQEVKTAQAQLESSQTELRQSRQEFTEIQQEVETAQAQLESSQTELRQSQQELTETQQEVETAQAQLESSQTELRQSQQEFTEIQQEVETAQAQLESSQTELRQSQQELTEIQQEVETAQTEVQQSQQELTEIRQEVQTSQTRLESSQTQLQQSQQQLTEIQQEVETVQTEVQQSQQQLTETQQEAQTVQAQLESAQVARLEVGFTSEYEQYLGITNTPITSLEDVRDILRQMEEDNDVKSAFTYAKYMPTPKEEEQKEATTAYALQSLLEKNQEKPSKHWLLNASELSNSQQPMLSQNLQEQENDELELVLVTAEGKLIRQRLGATRAEIRRVAREFRRAVTDVKDPNGYLAPSQKLYKLLFEPLEQNLQTQEIQNVAFLMDKGLRSLPLAALHDGEKFLVEKYGLGIMPGLSLTNLGPVDVRSSQVLAMGAEVFPDQTPLPAVPVELDVITRQLWPGEAYLNESFTVETLKQAREEESFSIVHFATHAEFREGRANNSYIQLWDDKITLDELRELELNSPPVSLLVLSACRTAVGSKEAELGFAGLAVQAGVSTAMGSLWYVSDEGTLGLMTKFYEELKQIPVKAEALRQTQLAMLRGEVRIEDGELVVDDNRIPLPPELAQLSDRDFSHPYYWSAFTLIGNPW